MPDIELSGEAVVKLGPLEITLRSAGDKLLPIEAVRRLSREERLAALAVQKETLERHLHMVNEEICRLQEP